MHNAGQAPFAMPDDVEALARQYWSTWAEAMRGGSAAGSAHDARQPWQQPMEWWTTLAKGGRHGSDDVLGRFNGQAQQWLSTMQQVAAQFAGRDAGAADIASAWRQALAGMGGMNGTGGFGAMPAVGAAGFPGMGDWSSGGANPFAALMQGMQQGPGLHGFDHWMQQVGPWLKAAQHAASSMPAQPAMPELPTFGFTRERDERWQRLARDQVDLQTRMQAYATLMMQATQDAFGIFESKLAEHEEPGRQLGSARALFDLWIDAAEQAYAKVALSAEFRTVYGELVDAQMRVRAGVQSEVEHVCEQVGMPTRTELDGAHRKIVELERQVRRLRDVTSSATSPLAARAVRARTGAGAPASDASVVDARSAAARKTARKKVARRKAAPANEPVKKAAKKIVKKAARKAAKKSETIAAKAAKPTKAVRASAARPVVVQAAAPARAKASARRKPRKITQPKASSPSRARKGGGKKVARKSAKATRAALSAFAVKRGPLPIFAHVSMPVAPAANGKKVR